MLPDRTQSCLNLTAFSLNDTSFMVHSIIFVKYTSLVLWVRIENIMILKSTVSYFVQVMLNIFPCHQPTL